MNWKIPAAIAVGAALIAGAIVVVSNGDDEEGGGNGTTTAAAQTDGAFITGMIPHHEDAIEMAEIAQTRAQHPEVKELAGAIISAQQEEIVKLTAAHQRLFGGPVSEGDHGTMGMDDSEMGMNMDPAELETAKPFDRAFIDMMVPHHQGAIRMARAELSQGEDPELQAIATAIVEAQAREIREMNQWRERWYGAPSPAGGVPAEEGPDGSAKPEQGMGTMEGM